MPKVLHVSFLWDDSNVNQRHSDYILALGWVKRGWDVLYFDYRLNAEAYGNDKMNAALIDIVDKHKPDIIFFTKCEGSSNRVSRTPKSCIVHPESLSQIKKNGFKGTIVHWFLDQRKDLFKSSVNLAKECDWFFYVAAGDRLKDYHTITKTPTSYIAVPYEQSFLDPQPFENRSIDLIWMGGAHQPNKNQFEDNRYNILQGMIQQNLLHEYYGCFGKKKIWCPEYQTLLGESKMGLSLYAFDRPLYFSNRLSHITGSNTALVSFDFKERSRIFSNDDGIFFKDVPDFKKKYLYYLKHLDEVKCISDNGYKIAQQYFSSTRVVEEILYTLRNGESSLPFGETYNTNKKKYDVPQSQKEFGNIYYLNINGNVLTIDQYQHNATVIPEPTPIKNGIPEPNIIDFMKKKIIVCNDQDILRKKQIRNAEHRKRINDITTMRTRRSKNKIRIK